MLICTKLSNLFADLPAVYCYTWWGVWEDGLDQISCPAVGWDRQVDQAPAVQKSPRLGSASAAPPGERGPDFWERCLFLCGGS